MIIKHLTPWFVLGMLALVQCTYSTGKGQREDETGSGGLGGADAGSGGNEASGGRPSPDGSGATKGTGGAEDGGGAGGTNATGGTADATGGAADAAGGTASATGGTADATGGAADAAGGAVSGTGGAADGTGGAADGTGGAGSGGTETGGGGMPAEPPHLVVMSKTEQFRHVEAINAGLSALTTMAAADDIQLTLTEDAAFFTDENLADVDAVLFLNTTGNIFSSAEELAFESYISNGGGFIGVHAAVDTEPAWAFYIELLGTSPTLHSSIVQASMDVEISDHPATEGVPDPWMRTDEWYNFSSNPRGQPGLEVLLTLDENSYMGGTMTDHPIAWTRVVGASRIFYTGMGHTGASYSEPEFLSHLRGGILWVLNRP